VDLDLIGMTELNYSLEFYSGLKRSLEGSAGGLGWSLVFSDQSQALSSASVAIRRAPTGAQLR